MELSQINETLTLLFQLSEKQFAFLRNFEQYTFLDQSEFQIVKRNYKNVLKQISALLEKLNQELEIYQTPEKVKDLRGEILCRVFDEAANAILGILKMGSPLLGALPWKKGAGKNVMWVIENLITCKSEVFSEGQDVILESGADERLAVIPWSAYRSQFMISGMAKSLVKEEEYPEVIKRSMLHSLKILANQISSHMYKTNQHGLVALDEAIADSNTYATQDRTDLKDWRANVFDPGVPVELSFDTLRNDLSDIYKNCGERPNFATVSPATMNQIGKLFQLTSQDSTPRFVMFDGCKFVEDKNAPEGTIYYLNTNYVYMEYLSNWDVEDSHLGLRAQWLAKQGDCDVGILSTYIQLVVEKPNTCGVRKNILIS